MCPLPLCCFNDGQKCKRKIVKETQTTQIEKQITQKKHKEEQQEKKLRFESTILLSWVFW